MLNELWCAGTTRRYWWSASALMAVYLIALLFALKLAPALHSPWLRLVAVLSPVPPVAGFVWLEYRRILVTDELRQRMELESGMLTLAVCVPLLLALGLLDNAGMLDFDLLFVTPVLLTIYVLAQVWAHRRYR